jgi:microcystin-dependent protein
MADPFVAEIRIFPFNFPPKGWAFCDGQLMPLSQNTALFSLLGTFYGGDGKSTFALPDLQGSAPMFWGQSSGGSLFDLGQTGGSETVTLLVNEMPFHTHVAQGSFTPADLKEPQDGTVLTRSLNGDIYNTTVSNIVQFAPQALAPAGGSLPHNNMMSYLTLNFCIALQGVFPARP